MELLRKVDQKVVLTNQHGPVSLVGASIIQCKNTNTLDRAT